MHHHHQQQQQQQQHDITLLPPLVYHGRGPSVRTRSSCTVPPVPDIRSVTKHSGRRRHALKGVMPRIKAVPTCKSKSKTELKQNRLRVLVLILVSYVCNPLKALTVDGAGHSADLGCMFNPRQFRASQSGWSPTTTDLYCLACLRDKSFSIRNSPTSFGWT